MNDLKEFLKDNPLFNNAEICRAINWDTGSFSRWKNGKGTIPQKKEEELRLFLKKFGFNEK